MCKSSHTELICWSEKSLSTVLRICGRHRRFSPPTTKHEIVSPSRTVSHLSVERSDGMKSGPGITGGGCMGGRCSTGSGTSLQSFLKSSSCCHLAENAAGPPRELMELRWNCLRVCCSPGWGWKLCLANVSMFRAPRCRWNRASGEKYDSKVLVPRLEIQVCENKHKKADRASSNPRSDEGFHRRVFFPCSGLSSVHIHRQTRTENSRVTQAKARKLQQNYPTGEPNLSHVKFRSRIHNPPTLNPYFSLRVKIAAAGHGASPPLLFPCSSVWLSQWAQPLSLSLSLSLAQCLCVSGSVIESQPRMWLTPQAVALPRTSLHSPLL